MSDNRANSFQMGPAGQFDQAFAGMNEAFASTLERNVEAQAALVETMTDAVFGSVPDESEMAEGIEGYVGASEVWLDAADQTFEEMTAAMEEEELDPETFRDIWLRATNEALSELLSTDAFAAANGQLIQAMLGQGRDLDAMQQDSLAQVGFATQEDVSEVAERLVELERRQQDVEETLDDILEAVE
jgi:hypothetical protein